LKSFSFAATTTNKAKYR